MTLFLERLEQNWERLGEKTAVIFTHPTLPQTLTYADLRDGSNAAIAYLQAHGVQAGDCVAVRLPKCVPFIHLYLGVMRMGCVLLPLNPAYPERELAYFLQNSQAALFVTDQAVGEEIGRITKVVRINPQSPIPTQQTTDNRQQITDNTQPSNHPTIQPDQTALMIYTSGTTGQPKGAEITHRNLTAQLDGLHEAWGWREDDVILHVLPIFHIHGLVVALHGGFHAGATAVLLPKFDAQEALAQMVAHRCTVLMAVPAIHKRLVDVPNGGDYDLSHVRLITSGSDRLPDDLFIRFRDTFGHTLLERYGMTETGLTLSNPLDGERRVGAVGMPLPGVAARVVDPATDEPLPDETVGELQIRGDNVSKGYWQMAEKTAASFTTDGWFKTGDLAQRSVDGYYTLKGRGKDLIISGGLNIYPPEVELVLAELDGVAASAVIGCLDEEWGERVTAVIVKTPNATLTADDVITHCRANLAPYKSPKAVRFVDNLPANALGKVQKAKLRDALCE